MLNRGGEGTGRGDDVQDGRFSTNQTNEDPPTSRRDEGILGSSTQRAPQGKSDGSTEPGVMILQLMLEADINPKYKYQVMDGIHPKHFPQ